LRIDEAYVPDMNQRLMMYRQVAGARTDEELDRMLDELRDRYGPLPEAVVHLEQYGRIRILADRLGVESVDREGQTVVIKFKPAPTLNLDHLVRVVGRRGDTVLAPPAAVKLDLKASAATTPARAGRQRPETGPSWWTARAATGEVTAGFSKEALLRPPKEDPDGPQGVFTKVRSLLAELAGIQ
jgi:transcription-repair coupling factor (superfamily II helicase)